MCAARDCGGNAKWMSVRVSETQTVGDIMSLTCPTTAQARTLCQESKVSEMSGYGHLKLESEYVWLIKGGWGGGGE